MTCVCKNILSVKHVLLESPITRDLFQKNGYDFSDCNNVRDILYNTDIIISIVKFIVHSPVGKLVFTYIIIYIYQRCKVRLDIPSYLYQPMVSLTC